MIATTYRIEYIADGERREAEVRITANNQRDAKRIAGKLAGGIVLNVTAI